MSRAYCPAHFFDLSDPRRMGRSAAGIKFPPERRGAKKVGGGSVGSKKTAVCKAEGEPLPVNGCFLF